MQRSYNFDNNSNNFFTIFLLLNVTIYFLIGLGFFCLSFNIVYLTPKPSLKKSSGSTIQPIAKA